MREYNWLRSTENDFVVWKAVPTVPTVMSEYVESLLFFYPTLDDALLNRNVGGSGFMLGKEYKAQSGLAHQYAVTNTHVSGDNRIARFVNRSGDETILDLGSSTWFDLPTDDVAVCSVKGSAWFSKVPMVRASSMLSEEELADAITSFYENRPQYGDDVFMVSRLANERLVARSVPVVRFGTLATKLPVAVENPTGSCQDSFLVEMRSISGHSGSPVFLHFNDSILNSEPIRMANDDSGIRLLGIDWGHLNTSGENAWNAGIACVVPAWKIAALLEDEDLVKDRKRTEREWLASTKIGASQSNLDSLPSGDGLDRMTDLTRKLLQVPKSEVDEVHRDHQP